jgi:hypothetical protein
MKYCEETVNEICEYIAEGLPNKQAAALAGISETQFYDWKGKKPKFSERVKEARAKFVAHHVNIIKKAGEEGHWQASAWLLERSFPDEFSLYQNLRIKSEEDEDVNIVIKYGDGKKDSKDTS